MLISGIGWRLEKDSWSHYVQMITRQARSSLFFGKEAWISGFPGQLGYSSNQEWEGSNLSDIDSDIYRRFYLFDTGKIPTGYYFYSKLWSAPESLA